MSGRRHPRRAARWIAVATCAVLVATTAACGDDGSTAGDGGARVVTLVTYDGYALPDAAARDFRRRTGWKIEVKSSGDAGSALSAAILTAGRPEGDVFFGVDNTFLTRAQGSDAFERYRPDALDQVPSDLRLDDTGRFTPIDESSVCVNADVEWFASRGTPLPTDLASLATAPYRDLLVVENPATSSPGLAFLAASRAVFGSGTDAYWRRLHSNGVAVAASWDDAWNSRYTVNGGDRPLVVSYASSPPAEVVYSDGKLTHPESTVLDRTCFRQVEFAAVLAGTPHRRAARQLVDEMLTPRWQAQLPLSNFVYPARRGVELPDEFRRWAEPVSHPITIGADDIGRHRDEWIDAWRSVME
jgi:thiamine transport system substrate-binding protein